MQIGLLTAPFGDTDLEQVIEWAGVGDGGEGFDALEVACGPGARHIDTATFTQADAERIITKLGECQIGISSLACYCNTTPEDPAEQQKVLANLKQVVDSAALLGVGIVCTLAGMPHAGKSREQTIEASARGLFPELCDYAGEKNIKIALENWFATNICGLNQFEQLFATVPHANFGLNYDPSHLVHQGIDHLMAVDLLASRIFHTHAKDVEINHSKLAYLGNQGRGWWRYVIPGFGEIHWGRYVGALRRNKYDGVLSIEHEDSSQSREEGFVRGLDHLSQFV